MLSIIAAVGQNNEIGKNGKLIWHIPEDLLYFRNITYNHTIIMGRGTFESLNYKCLPNRINIVITSKETSIIGEGMEDNTPLIFETDVNNIILKYQYSKEEVFVIGGGAVYNLFLPYAKKLYIAEIQETDNDADTFFPDFEKEKYVIVKQSILKHTEENIYPKIHFRHVVYEVLT